METKKLKLDFEMEISDIVSLNKSFASAKCLIAYCGRNRNRSDISKEVFIQALPSLKNVPIVARYDSEKDDFGGHDIRIVSKDEGIDIVNATIPFGVVPESAKQWFEEVTLPNGEKRDGIFTDLILWKRQYGYKHIVESKKISQSMEINTNSYIIDNDNYCVIENMEFEALTLLGSNIEPCFENASIQLYSSEALNTYKTQFSLMLSELKELNQSSQKEVDIDDSSKGGTEMEDNNEVVVEEVIEDVVEVVVEEQVAETVVEEQVEKVTEEPATEETVAETVTDFSNDVTILQEKYENLLIEFNEYKNNYSTTNSEVDLLVKYKNDKSAEERLVAENVIFTKFEEKIGDTEEFTELKAKACDFSLKELEKECLCIVGLHTDFVKETKKQEVLKFSVEKDNEEEKDVYGGLFKKHLNK